MEKAIVQTITSLFYPETEGYSYQRRPNSEL